MNNNTSPKVDKLTREFSDLTDDERREFYALILQGAKPEELGDEFRPIKTKWSVTELLDTEFPEPKWALPGIIPVGLTFLAGRPKLGKSWLALQLAHAVGTGGQVFGQKVELGKVLFLALEDSPRRLKNRLLKQRFPVDANVTFETTWKPLPEGGLVDLQIAIGQEGYTFVAIDTFSRAMGRADQLDQAEMTVICGNLQQLSMTGDLAILATDHHRKPFGNEGNPVDDILGSTAKAAIVDAAIGLYREQGKHEAILKVIGRELEEKELALAWDGELGCWQFLGNANDVREDTFKGDVLQAIHNLIEDGELATTKNIAKHLGKGAPSVSRALADLLNLGKIKRGEPIGREKPYIYV